MSDPAVAEQVLVRRPQIGDTAAPLRGPAPRDRRPSDGGRWTAAARPAGGAVEPQCDSARRRVVGPTGEPVAATARSGRR